MTERDTGTGSIQCNNQSGTESYKSPAACLLYKKTCRYNKLFHCAIQQCFFFFSTFNLLCFRCVCWENLETVRNGENGRMFSNLQEQT